MKSFADKISDKISLYTIEQYTKLLLQELEYDKELHARVSMAGVSQGIEIAEATIEAMLERAREDLK